MSVGKRPFSRIAAPIRGITQRFAYMGMILLAMGLMILGKVDALLMERVRVITTDAIAPILDVISRPFDSINNITLQVQEAINIREDNIRLRKENKLLLQWQEVARKLDAENRALREAANFVPDAQASFITARVIADTGGAFAHSLLLNAGERNGVRKGQAAVTGNGLLGRVADVGSRSARILLITDLNSRIPVVIESSRVRAILTGDNSDKPRLIHLPPGAVISQGDRVVTSGHGGAFTPGLPVGVVSSVSESGISVLPFVKSNQVEITQLLDFGLSGIIKSLPVKQVR